MPRFPRVTAREIDIRLRAAGFYLVRQKGSHKIYKDANGTRVVFPFHGSSIVSLKIVKDIMRDAGITEW